MSIDHHFLCLDLLKLKAKLLIVFCFELLTLKLEFRSELLLQFCGELLPKLCGELLPLNL